jgi:hypothetical protein
LRMHDARPPKQTGSLKYIDANAAAVTDADNHLRRLTFCYLLGSLSLGSLFGWLDGEGPSRAHLSIIRLGNNMILVIKVMGISYSIS